MALAIASRLFVAGPARAARPIRGGRYVGSKSELDAALQVSKNGRSLSWRRHGSYVTDDFHNCTVRLVSRRGPSVPIHRDGSFRIVRGGVRALKLRGRFATRDTARIRLRTRCGRGRLRARLTLHRKGDPPFSGCGTQRASNLVLGPTGRIFEQRRVVGYGFVPVAYGCLFAVNRRFELGVDDKSGEFGESELSLFRLVDPYAGAIARDTPVVGEFACANSVFIVDLRSGKPKVVGDSVGRSGLYACVPVTDFELKGNASTAWITDLGDRREVWADDGLGRRRLDASPGIQADSLTLDGSTLTWVKDGVERSATLY